jgi:hypothetical protein
MYIYVIASSESGPSKIGAAINPEKRLRALQTGSHALLSLHHVEPVGVVAATVEHTAHRLLSAKRSGGGREWFDVSTSEARIAVRASAAAAEALIDESSKLRDVEMKAALRWLRGREQYLRACEERGEDGCDEADVKPPSVLHLLAGTVKPPLSSNFNFNDYLLTFDDGMWLRWAFGRMGRHMPSGKRLKPYFEADDFLERQRAILGRGVASRWIEWSAARDLRADEATTLAEIWNKFVPLHNLIERKGPQSATHGIDDHVDDVHLFALSGDERRGDGWYAVFWHKEFRAVLIPERNVELHHIDWSMISEVRPLGKIPVSGFVSSPMPRDIWERPFLPWLRDAPHQRDIVLARFLNNPTKRYPAPRPYDGHQPATQVWIDLPCIDDDGKF